MRGSISRRGKRSWRLKYDVERVGGARQIRYATVQGTRKDAEAELAKRVHEVNTGAAVDPSTITTATYLRTWLAGLHGLTAGSIETYTLYIEKILIPAVGHIRLQKLKPIHVKMVIDAGAGRVGSTRYAYRLLKAALQAAADLELISRNIASSIKPPAAEVAEVDILRSSQITAVLDALKGSSLFPIVSLALATGMRRGELLALRWTDLDIDAATVRVERALEDTSAGHRFKAPKTSHGRRTITLPASTLDVLRNYRKQQLEGRMALGLGKPGPDALVFCDHGGEPLRPDRVTSTWRRATMPLGIDVKFHALRHTHASALIAAHVDIVTISRRLGHSSAAFTLRTYAHMFAPTDASAAAAIGKLLG